LHYSSDPLGQVLVVIGLTGCSELGQKRPHRFLFGA
jgi:hypothetical protein